MAPETFRPEALTQESDRDPVDVVLRRTAALAADLKGMPKAPDLAALEKQLAELQKAAARIVPGGGRSPRRRQT